MYLELSFSSLLIYVLSRQHKAENWERATTETRGLPLPNVKIEVTVVYTTIFCLMLSSKDTKNKSKVRATTIPKCPVPLAFTRLRTVPTMESMIPPNFGIQIRSFAHLFKKLQTQVLILAGVGYEPSLSTGPSALFSMVIKLVLQDY